MSNPETISEILTGAKTIAVVGMSDKPSRASYSIGRYLAQHGYKVYPVNPSLETIDGMKCYPDLGAAQAAACADGGNGIDLVNVFRAPEFVPEIVKDAMRYKVKYLWLQDGVMHDEAIGWAEHAGIKCVQDDCIYRRHAARM